MRSRYLHGPVTEQHYRYHAGKLASYRASERTRAGSHIRHNRFRFEATRRGCRSYCHTYFSGNGVPCTIFAFVTYIYTIYPPPSRVYVNFIRKIIYIYIYVYSYTQVNHVPDHGQRCTYEKKKQIILRLIRVTYLRNFHHRLRIMCTYTD
jgi:hypothetical protein